LRTSTHLTRAKGRGQTAKVRNELTMASCSLKTGAKRRTRLLPFALCPLPLLMVFVAGCRQDMHDAPRYDPYEESAFLPNHSSAQPLVAGTVPREEARGAVLDEDELLHTGKINGQFADVFPFAITRADLDRGEERFNIYCSPCHGRTGEGNGMVVQRGYRQAANYHIERLRKMPAGYFVDVMTNGFGVMPDYRTQVPAADRWRITAYIRALQISHAATEQDVPAEELGKLKKDAPAASPATAPAAGHGRGGQQ
jgi:mono/diheme cytochrome c family protein